MYLCTASDFRFDIDSNSEHENTSSSDIANNNMKRITAQSEDEDCNNIATCITKKMKTQPDATTLVESDERLAIQMQKEFDCENIEELDTSQ